MLGCSVRALAGSVFATVPSCRWRNPRTACHGLLAHKDYVLYAMLEKWADTCLDRELWQLATSPESCLSEASSDATEAVLRTDCSSLLAHEGLGD